MTKDEALKLALEALIGARAFLESDAPVEIWGVNDKAITAIKEALAQPEPWEKFCDSNCVWTDHHPDCKLAEQEQDLWAGATIDERWYITRQPKQTTNYSAQPEQKPVAYINVEQRKLEWAKYMTWDTPTVVNLPKIPLYTTPPPVAEPHKRKPLTDEEITDAVRESGLDWHYAWTLSDDESSRLTKFARAIEAAHGIKGEA